MVNSFLRSGLLFVASTLLLACQGMTPSEIETSALGEGLINGKSETRSIQFAVVLQISKGSKVATCTGSVIGEKLILTAGHCLKGTDSSSEIRVYRSVKKIWGGWDLEYIGNFDSWIVHKQYANFEYSHSDIALGKLDRNIPENMRPIKLVGRDWIYSNDFDYIFVGAGSKKPIPEQDSTQSTVQEGYFVGTARLKYSTAADFKNSKSDPNPISSGARLVLDTKSLEYTYICSGDSGGAFVESNNKGELNLVGVLVASGYDDTPEGESCNGKIISIVPVAVHKKWINEAVAKLRQ